MNGTYYVPVTLGGASPNLTIAGQVKNQDGTSIASVVDVLVRTVATLVTDGLIAVNTGTAQVGAGTQNCWLKTTSAGAFSVTITSTLGTKVLVEIVPTPGETLLVPLQF